MTYTVTHRGGQMEDGDESSIAALLAELSEPLDDEHPDVSVTDDDTGWTLSAFQGGRLVWGNEIDEEDDRESDGDGAPRHMVGVSQAEAARVMRLVADGRLAEVHALDWRPGYQ